MDSYELKDGERWVTLKNGKKVVITAEGSIAAGLPDKYIGRHIDEVAKHLEARYNTKQKNKLLKRVDPAYSKEATKLFNEAASGKGLDTYKKVPFRKIDYTEAQRLKRHTGLDLEGFEHVVSNMDFRHMHEGHGVGNEKDPKQREVTQNDILLIPEITKNFDTARLSTIKEGRYIGKKAIVYEKKIDNEYFYVEMVNEGKAHNLSAKTMYIKK
jgi:hypothetical protein